MSQKGSKRAFAALLSIRDMVLCQRRVGVADGRGGSEKPSCKHQTYQPFALAAQLGTKGAL